MEAMEHTYFFPIVKDQGRMNTLSGGSPTASGMAGGGANAASGSGVPNSPILSPGSTPIPSGGAGGAGAVGGGGGVPQ